MLVIYVYPSPNPEDQLYLSDMSHGILGGGSETPKFQFLKGFCKENFFFENPECFSLILKNFRTWPRRQYMRFLGGAGYV